jgi:small-conductance mechanosensitive channel
MVNATSIFTTQIFGVVLSKLLMRIIVAAVILLLGFIIGKIVGRLVHRALHEIELNESMRKAGLKFGIEDLISNFITYLIYFVAIIWALSELGLSTMILSIIFIAIIVIVIVSMILAFKDFLPNLFAGLFIYKKEFIKNGNWIKINGVEGKIKKIGLVETEVETKSKDVVYVPNSNLTKQAVVVSKKKK